MFAGTNTHVGARVSARGKANGMAAAANRASAAGQRGSAVRPVGAVTVLLR
jgi:hypothetical protein